ncbi:hypothetical protein D3C85_1901410 [compost metagenome]
MPNTRVAAKTAETTMREVMPNCGLSAAGPAGAAVCAVSLSLSVSLSVVLCVVFMVLFSR